MIPPVYDTEARAELLYHTNTALLQYMSSQRLTTICRCYAITQFLGCGWPEDIEIDMQRLGASVDADDLASQLNNANINMKSSSSFTAS